VFHSSFTSSDNTRLAIISFTPFNAKSKRSPIWSYITIYHLLCPGISLRVSPVTLTRRSRATPLSSPHKPSPDPGVFLSNTIRVRTSRQFVINHPLSTSKGSSKSFIPCSCPSCPNIPLPNRHVCKYLSPSHYRPSCSLFDTRVPRDFKSCPAWPYPVGVTCSTCDHAPGALS